MGQESEEEEEAEEEEAEEDEEEEEEDGEEDFQYFKNLFVRTMKGIFKTATLTKKKCNIIYFYDFKWLLLNIHIIVQVVLFFLISASISLSIQTSQQKSA